MNATNRILGEAMTPKQRAIYKDAQKAFAWAYTYDIRFPQAEPYIAKDPAAAYQYAYHLLGGRWPEAEAAIATESELSYYYAKELVKGRWPKGEPAIARDPEWVYHYAVDVIDGRWPEGEATIASSDSRWKDKYLKAFPDAQDDWVANGWMDWLDT